MPKLTRDDGAEIAWYEPVRARPCCWRTWATWTRPCSRGWPGPGGRPPRAHLRLPRRRDSLRWPVQDRDRRRRPGGRAGGGEDRGRRRGRQRGRRKPGVRRLRQARPDRRGGRPGSLPLPARTSGGEGLAASISVLKALLTLLETDYRPGVYAFVSSGNPGYDDAAIQQRVDSIVAHCRQEAALERIRSWVADDPTEPARQLGDRLWILHHEANPWFSGSEGPREVCRRPITGGRGRPDGAPGPDRRRGPPDHA